MRILCIDVGQQAVRLAGRKAAASGLNQSRRVACKVRGFRRVTSKRSVSLAGVACGGQSMREFPRGRRGRGWVGPGSQSILDSSQRQAISIPDPMCQSGQHGTMRRDCAEDQRYQTKWLSTPLCHEAQPKCLPQQLFLPLSPLPPSSTLASRSAAAACPGCQTTSFGSMLTCLSFAPFFW